jgi:L-ascorbate metabolism protein UlaG (beta-lactamase superfamily)
MAENYNKTTVSVTYFDTAMALINVGGFRILTDPVFDDDGTVFEYGPVRLEKTGKRSVRPEDLGRIDAVLLSHDQHGDNLDNAGREFLRSVPLVLTTPLASTRLDGTKSAGLANWESHVLRSDQGEALTITGVPSQHAPDGMEEISGPTVGFILQPTENRAPVIYWTGDTVRFAGTKEIASRYAPIDLLLVNIGRVRLPVAGEHEFTLSASEAAAYANELQAKQVVPLHFEGWAHFTEGLEEIKAQFELGGIAGRTVWLSSGEKADFIL